MLKKNLLNDKSLEMNVAISRKNHEQCWNSLIINDSKESERKSWELTVCSSPYISKGGHWHMASPKVKIVPRLYLIVFEKTRQSAAYKSKSPGRKLLSLKISTKTFTLKMIKNIVRIFFLLCLMDSAFGK